MFTLSNDIANSDDLISALAMFVLKLNILELMQAELMFQDVIVHVFDASHPDKGAQIEHVRETLSKIMADLQTKSKAIIEVGNKCDLISSGTLPENILGVSAVNSTGEYMNYR